MMEGPGFDGGEFFAALSTTSDALGFPVTEETLCFKFGRDMYARDIFRVVEREVGSRIGSGERFDVCPTSSAFYRFRKTVAEYDADLAARIKPGTSIDGLVTEEERPRLWKHLNERGLQLPKLRYPRWLKSLRFWAAATVFLFIMTVLHFLVWPESVVPKIVAGIVLVPALFVCDYRIANRYLWEYAQGIPRPLDTVANLAKYLAYRDCKPGWVPHLTQNQCKDVVRLAIALEFDMRMDEVDDAKLWL
ncbi:MAG: hypothetical protein R3E58_13230 [Phycisphaerae bacterium]